MMHEVTEKGFSLIELIVSVAILTMISTLVLVNHNRFGGSVLLGDLAYDVALSIRQAQVFGLSVREFGIGSGTFDVGYGVHFNTFFAGTSYVLFSDINDDQKYTYSPTPLDSSEDVEIFSIGRGNIVSEFCGIRSDLSEDCSTDGDITSLDIVFARPNPEAIITSSIPSIVYRSAYITVSTPSGLIRTVSVQSTGQVSVQQTAS